MSWDAAVESVQRAAGIDRVRAEAIVRANAGRLGVTPAPDPDTARDARILEDAEQHEITRRFRAHGFTVRSTSQKRPAKVSPDFPDLWVTRAARPRFPAALAFWWETKRQVGGTRTSGQVDFGDECIAAGVGYGFGDRYAAAAYLRSLGIEVD